MIKAFPADFAEVLVMKTVLCENSDILGKKAAAHIARLLKETVREKGEARLLVSTGASQFTTFEALISEEGINWEKIELFHLDEYIDLPDTHPASFIKYLKERFIEKLNGKFKKIHFVDTSEGAKGIIEKLNLELPREIIDLGVVGIGENAHIAFNDPPADFDCENAYKIVKLDEACRRQQLGEGWFETFDSVPKEAVSMTVGQILKCSHIISAVPYAAKAKAVHDTLTSEKITNMIPATALRAHPDWTLYIDRESASLLGEEYIKNLK